MGKHHPTPLERALGGDAEAVLAVVEGVVGPLYDLAVHLAATPAAARGLADGALRELTSAIESGSLPHPDPLAVAARSVVRAAAPSRAGAKVESLAGVSPEDALAAVVVLAADLDAAAAAFVLDRPADQVAPAVARAVAASGGDRALLAEELDRAASESPLPGGLLDFLEEP